MLSEKKKKDLKLNLLYGLKFVISKPEKYEAT